MTGLPEKLRTYFRLGPMNLIRVGTYRIGLKTGLHPVLRIRANASSGPYFAPAQRDPAGLVARSIWQDTGELFGRHRFPLPVTPDWHANPFREGVRADSARRWHRIGDFDPALGDIKAVWELSRFDWLLAMAQQAALGDAKALARANRWLADWSKSNPPFRGVNWKCGQEASIRVMHLAASAIMLGQAEAPLPGLQELVLAHLRRIAPTMAYAIGQQNNHGTSEAAALFIGGSWMAQCGHADGRRWMETGRRWLERLGQDLIEPDGTFSQYSAVYQRVMLDTYSLAEVWRKRSGLPAFSGRLHARLRLAVQWLRQLTDPVNGDAPNLGANDGARLIPLSDTGFRDFRPSVQLAAGLFCGARAYSEPGLYDQPLRWFGIPLPDSLLPAMASQSFDAGGLHVLRSERAVAYLRYPRFRFRPCQSDALHLDLWVNGNNLLRDGGSFSYNSSEGESEYFSGGAAHNTVQFDGRDQMPLISRFLFAAWLKARDVETAEAGSGYIRASAGYVDDFGAMHHRTVTLGPDALSCTDKIGGDARNAVMRWRLAPGNWTIDGNTVSNGQIHIAISGPHAITMRIADGLESRHYLEKTALPVLEVSLPVPATVKSEIRF